MLLNLYDFNNYIEWIMMFYSFKGLKRNYLQCEITFASNVTRITSLHNVNDTHNEYIILRVIVALRINFSDALKDIF